MSADRDRFTECSALFGGIRKMFDVTLESRPFDLGMVLYRRHVAPHRRADFTALLVAAGTVGAMLGGAMPASAHGIVGQRFFPATLSTDDPFVADEMSLPTFTHQKTGADPSVKETDVNFDFAKTITPDFGFVMGYGWRHLDQLGPPHNPSGFSTFHITPQYQLLKDGPREAVAMVGVIAEIGGTGAQRIGADMFTTLTPTLYLGKGAGDLPEAMNLLRPFAVTGTIGYSTPPPNTTPTQIIDPDTGDVSL